MTSDAPTEASQGPLWPLPGLLAPYSTLPFAKNQALSGACKANSPSALLDSPGFEVCTTSWNATVKSFFSSLRIFLYSVYILQSDPDPKASIQWRPCCKLTLFPLLPQLPRPGRTLRPRQPSPAFLCPPRWSLPSDGVTFHPQFTL